MIGIITDSTCDIPEELIKQYGILVIPHTVIWGNEQFRDRVDLQPIDFYRRLPENPQRPTTSQAGWPEFQQAYETAAAQGADEIVVLTVSSALSGAYQMAVNAAKMVKTPVHVVDSKEVTMGLGWQVLAAARAREAGASLNEILQAVERVRQSVSLLVGMDTLEYLQKGGRIGGAVKWVGGVLHVKPLVLVNPQSGQVEPVSLARTYKAMVDMLYSRFFDTMSGGKHLHVAVLHGNAPEKAGELAERIRAEHQPAELLMNITGPVLGINTGPGALALSGYMEE